jgi:tetratricopeptide (TPR) repeat protein
MLITWKMAHAQSMSVDEIRTTALGDLQGPTGERHWPALGGQPGKPRALSFGRTGEFGEFSAADSPSSDGQALGLISVAHLRHKVPQEAIQAFNRAVKFVQNDQRREATMQLEGAIRRDPEFMEAHGALGVQYVHLGRLDDAEVELRESIRLDPSFWTGYYNLAFVLLDLGRTPEAERCARRAFEISNNTRTQMVMGFVLARNPETRVMAEGYLRSAAHTLPAAAGLLRQLASVSMP